MFRNFSGFVRKPMAEERIFSKSSSSPMFFTRLRFVIKGQLQSIRAVPANTRAGISRKAKNRFYDPNFCLCSTAMLPLFKAAHFPLFFIGGAYCGKLSRPSITVRLLVKCGKAMAIIHESDFHTPSSIPVGNWDGRSRSVRGRAAARYVRSGAPHRTP